MTEIEKHARAANVHAERVPFLDNLPPYPPLLMEVVSALRCRVAELEQAKGSGGQADHGPR